MRKAVLVALTVLMLCTTAAPARERIAPRSNTFTYFHIEEYTSYIAAVATMALYPSALVHTSYPDAPFVVVRKVVITGDFVAIPVYEHFYVVEKLPGTTLVVGDGFPGTLPDGDVFALYRR